MSLLLFVVADDVDVDVDVDVVVFVVVVVVVVLFLLEKLTLNQDHVCLTVLNQRRDDERWGRNKRWGGWGSEWLSSRNHR